MSKFCKEAGFMRVDPRKYENWTSIGSHDQFSALQVRN